MAIPSRCVTLVRRLLVVVLAALVALAGTTAFASPASAGPVEDEAALFALTNTSRAQNGLAALAYDAAATGVARTWAQELARSGQLRHNPNLVANVDAFVTQAWTRVGENVGYAGSVEQVHNAYMNSAGHRANILGAYNRVGVGAARDGNNRLWTTVVFLQAPVSAPVAAPVAPAPATGAFAPFGSASAFANQQFVDFLGRPADSRSLMDWTAALQNGSHSPAGMVANLITSPEQNMLVDPVNRLYKAYFRRNPDVGGLNFWIGRLRAGITLGHVSNEFAASPEFRGTYGALNDHAFVDLVYRNVLGRPADAAGAGYWLTQLAAGRLNRGGVMVNFSESAEYRAGTAAWNNVVQVWVGLLRQSPPQNYLDNWENAFRNGRPVTDLISEILNSAEYRNRRF